MFAFGYCYAGDVGKAGFRLYGSVNTAKEAQAEIKKKLAGQKVEFKESDEKFRAHADGQPTGYIYFAVTAEQWIALDETLLSEKGKKAVFAKGDLATVKNQVRKKLDAENKDSLENISFTRTGDNIGVYEQVKGYNYPRPAGVILLKIS